MSRTPDSLPRGTEVYFVEGENALGEGQQVVKKATVYDFEPTRQYPVLITWNETQEGLREGGGMVSTEANRVFTGIQVMQALANQYSPLHREDVSVDDLVLDPTAQEGLTTALLAATRDRRATDLLYA